MQLLRAHDVALVVADTAGRWPLLERVTSDFIYVRLHGDKELYVSGYSAEALDSGRPASGAGPTRGWTCSSTSTTTSRCARRTTRMALMDRLGLTVG